MANVSIEHISKTYPAANRKSVEHRAITDLNMTVSDKEFMVIVGPSGCGKSSLLRMIAGLEEITEGLLKIDGKTVNHIAPSERDIAMVFQNYALYPHMTVYDNMAFGMRLRAHSKKEIREQVLRTAALLQLDEVLTSKPGNLSGGQRQRVAIGRAIIRRPKVFLFDEPLSNLDAKLRTQMRIELQKLHREIDATMIYVTHDQTEAMTLGDRIAVLNKGRLMQLATPLELYNSPENKFVAGFIGSPAMNFVNGVLENNGEEYLLRPQTGYHIPLGKELTDSQKKYTGKEIVAGIRPEHITIGDFGNAAGFQTQVAAYENMGNEQIIYTASGELNFILRRFQQSTITIGSQQTLCFESPKIMYFNPESGLRA